MDIHIQKTASVSLHSQLVTQISMQIASGLLSPGSKLPSIRALSRRLGIHHNTILSAYKELDTVGLIDIRHGSGARVALLAPDQQKSVGLKTDTSELQTLADFFVTQALQKGYGWEEALNALEVARRKTTTQPLQSLVFVDMHSDILPVFKAELETGLNRPVKAVTLDTLQPEQERNSHFVVSRYHCQSLRNRLKSAGFENPGYENPGYENMDERITLIEVGSVQHELDLIRQLPEGAMIGVVSTSAIILRQAEAVVQALRGEDIIIRTVMALEEPAAEIQRVAKRAAVVFADSLCALELAATSRKPVHTIRVIPERELEKLTAFKRSNSSKP
jgi:DNA-binding transcriptional regulator YhcF (GntR family)